MILYFILFTSIRTMWFLTILRDLFDPFHILFFLEVVIYLIWLSSRHKVEPLRQIWLCLAGHGTIVYTVMMVYGSFLWRHFFWGTQQQHIYTSYIHTLCFLFYLKYIDCVYSECKFVLKRWYKITVVFPGKKIGKYKLY